ncbi:MAG: lipoprotein signal peptidase [Gammaproteobacteria bacterium]|nr:lipoprotein signal peptidase [Gammaproteobacteria bacterium]
MFNTSIFKHPNIWFWLSALVIMLDQLTKIAAEHYLARYSALEIFPHFNLVLAYNSGAAFSFLSQAGGWQRWFFIILTTVISIGLIIWIRRLSAKAYWEGAAFSLILGGAIGNFIDRLAYGHVIDFLDVYYGRYHWPTFNIADSAITIGAVILISQSIFMKSPQTTAS